MLPIWLAFLVLSSAVFGIVMFATSPTAKDKIMAQRFWDVLKPNKTLRAGPNRNEATAKSAQQSEKSQLNFPDTAALRYLQRLVAHSHVDVSMKKLLWAMAVLAGVVFGISWYLTGMIPIAIALAAGGGALPVIYLLHRRKKWLMAFDAVLPDCIDTFSRSLKAGQSVVGCFDIVAQQAPAPANGAFADVFKKQRYGLPLREALYQMLEEVPSMDLKILITAVLVQKETGGNLPIVLDRLSAVIRDRIRIRRDVKVQTAQGRMTGWILGLLPPLLTLGINWISPGYSSPFLNDPIGRYLLYACIGLLVTGEVVIQRMVQGIEV